MTTMLAKLCRRFLHTSTPNGAKVRGPSPSADHDGGYLKFRNITVFIATPVILLVAGTCYSAKQEVERRPPFVQYEYMRRRTKRFPWGEGTKSLFHNSRVNALPDGYEHPEEVQGEEEEEEVPN